MDIKAKEIVLVAIDEIIFNKKNNNKHSAEQLVQLQKIIKYQGFRNPVTISNRSGFLVCGEGRVTAARNLGMTHVPAMYQDFKNEAEEYAHLTADNAIQQQSLIDFKLVNLELENLGKDFDIDYLGLKDFKIDVDVVDVDDKKEEKKSDDNEGGEHECPACGYLF